MKKTRLAGLNLVWFPPITYTIRHYYSYTPQYNADCDIIFGAYELESHESPILSGMMAFTRKETAQYLICNLSSRIRVTLRYRMYIPAYSFVEQLL